MVAYSFRRQFVNPIRLGLGLELLPDFPPAPGPKRHTIRADRKRGHVREGQTIHLYYAMRTKQCMAIGAAPVTETSPVDLDFDCGWAAIGGCRDLTKWGYGSLNAFAIGDGFESWNAMRGFWLKEHAVPRFAGTIIFWQGDQ